jgi:hypothetical protein
VITQYFFSCGAGSNQLPLLLAARSLGFGVAAADLNEAAPGFELADRSFVCSILDRKALIDAITGDDDLRQHLTGIGCRSYGRAVEIAASVARYFSLPANPHRALRFFRNKAKYKKTLQKWQVPVPADIRRFAKYIVRPSSGHAKEGLKIMERTYLSSLTPELSGNETALELTGEETFIEPFIEGRECILLGLVVQGSFYPVLLSDRFRNPDFSDRMHVFPSELSGSVRYEMVEHCRRIVRRSGLQNGPFLAEFIVDGNTPYLVECAPEVGGEFLADDMIPAVTGLPYFELLVHIYCGTDTDRIRRLLVDHLERERTVSMVIGFLAPSRDAFALQFSPSIYRHPGFYFARPLPVLPGQKPNARRPGVIALTGHISERKRLIQDMESFL